METINDTVETAIADIDSESIVPPYVSLWQSWKKKGLMAATTRTALSRIITGRTKIPKGEKHRTTIGKIITKIEAVLPPVASAFTFVKDSDDDLVYMQSKNNDSSNTETKSDTNSNDMNKNDGATIDNTPTTATAEVKANQSETLESDAKATDNEDDNNEKCDKDDTNDGWKTSKSTTPHDKAVIKSPGIEPTPTRNLFGALAAQEDSSSKELLSYSDSKSHRSTHNSIDDDSIERDIKDTNLTFATDENINISYQSSTKSDEEIKLSNDELEIMNKALAENNVHTVNENILCKWINNTTQDMHTSSTLLEQHTEQVRNSLIRHEKETHLRVKATATAESVKAINDFKNNIHATTENVIAIANEAKK